MCNLAWEPVGASLSDECVRFTQTPLRALARHYAFVAPIPRLLAVPSLYYALALFFATLTTCILFPLLERAGRYPAAAVAALRKRLPEKVGPDPVGRASVP